MPERVLVTGAAGFAGSHLLRHLSHAHIVAWTHRTAPQSEDPRISWRQVELLDRAAVRQAIETVQPTHVYHCAGSPHVATSWKNSAVALQSNVIGTHHLLDALRQSRARCRVLITGSAAIYAPSPVPIDESWRIAPASPYALSKLAQEQLGLRAIEEDGLEVVVARSFNHTGPGQPPAFVAPSMARQVARIERGDIEPVIQVGNLEARRDFTDVRDVVAAYAAMMALGRSGMAYNVASGEARSMHELLGAFLVRTSAPIRVEAEAARFRPHDIPVLVGNADRLRTATGWTPRIGFDQMIDDLLAYWRERVTAEA